MTLTTETPQLQLILTSWSSSLSIDDVTGESIVTQSDLRRLAEILTIIFFSNTKHLSHKSQQVLKSIIPVFHNSISSDSP